VVDAADGAAFKRKTRHLQNEGAEITGAMAAGHRRDRPKRYVIVRCPPMSGPIVLVEAERVRGVRVMVGVGDVKERFEVDVSALGAKSNVRRHFGEF
jgi:hypothetical protein